MYVVDNAGDDLAAVRHINACGGPAEHRAVLRPTPGAGDVQTTGWDLQVATGKPPHAARREHVSTLSWEYGQAWLAGSGVTDLIVDRAHLLTRGQAAAAAGAAAKAGTALWLLWGTGIDPYTPGYDGTPHLVAGTRTQVISLWELYQRLPAAAPPLTAVAEPGEPGDWPPLPAADFPTFLAACRRYLPRAEFAQVARLYYDTAEAADAWLDTYGAPRDPRDGQLTPGFEAATAGWLRDSAIGPAPCGPAALVRLRAVQAALFVRAIVLSWRPGPLGPQPATRLPGNLTPQVAGALQTAVRTDAAAATALSVHLNQGPAFFGLLQLSDVAPDGPPSGSRPAGHGPSGAASRRGLAACTARCSRPTSGAGASSPRPSPSASPSAPGLCSPRTWPTAAKAAPPAPTPTSRTPATPRTSPPPASCARRSAAPRSGSAWTCPGCTAMTAGTAPTSA